MGLDVRVYTDVQLVTPKYEQDDERWYDEWDFKAYVIDERWKDRINNLENHGLYKGKKADVDVHYTYSTHGWLRDKLCVLIDRVDYYWRNSTPPSKDIPFVEFIDFADNEGCLDWEVSEKLYRDLGIASHLINMLTKGFILNGIDNLHVQFEAPNKTIKVKPVSCDWDDQMGLIMPVIL